MCSVRERTEGGGGCSCVVSFGKWFTEKNFVNHFPIFYTRFSSQWKSFVFDQNFTTKQTLANTENIFRKTFYSETNRALQKRKRKKGYNEQN